MDGSYYSACDRYLSYPPMVSLVNPKILLTTLISVQSCLVIFSSGSSVGLHRCISDTASQHVHQLRDESYECVAQQHVKQTE